MTTATVLLSLLFNFADHRPFELTEKFNECRNVDITELLISIISTSTSDLTSAKEGAQLTGQDRTYHLLV